MSSEALRKTAIHGDDMSAVVQSKMFTSASELVSREICIEYLIEDWIEKGTSGLIFGPSGEGKTFIVLDMGLSIATGTPCAGHKTEQGLVIYFCGEGHSRIPHRIMAWQKAKGMSKENLKLFYASETTLELENVNEIVKEIKEISKNYGIPVSLVIVDTLAQHLPDDWEENSTKDIKKFLKLIAKLRKADINCTSLLVHHPGHNAKNRARGASSLKGTLDFEMFCNNGHLEFTKMKDGKLPEKMSVKLKPIEIGIDVKRNKVVTSTVAIYGKAENCKKRFTEKQKLGITALTITIIQSGNVETMTTNYEAWRCTFYRLVRDIDPNLEQSSLNKQFNRMVQDLSEKLILKVNAKQVALLDKEQQEIFKNMILSEPGQPGQNRDMAA